MKTIFAQSIAKAAAAFVCAVAFAVSPVAAQELETFDPDEVYSAPTGQSAASAAIDADLAQGSSSPVPAPPLPASPQPVPADQPGPATVETTAQPGFDEEFATYGDAAANEQTEAEAAAKADGAEIATADPSATYAEDDLIGAAEGVFGKGAEGLAKMIEDLLRKQGEPNGYIVGREAGGAFIFGARYGSGTLYHKVEGEKKVYWTGPSVGFDAGANAGNTFVLVYNLYDTEDLYERFPAGEGQAYLIGGMHASYMRKGDIVLIPIRMGAGLRLGVNAGYMKFSKKQRWLPF